MSDYDMVKSKELYELVKSSETDEEAALKLIADPMVNVNFAPESELGRTPLLRAALKGHFNIARVLLERPDINVNQADNDGCTALYFACLKGEDNLVQLLLGQPNVKVNQVNKHGWTPLFIGSSYGQEKVMELLLKHPIVNLNQADNDGCTALYSASRNGHEKVVKQLLASHHPVDVLAKPDYASRTAAERGKDNGHLEIFDLLKSFEPSNDPMETRARQAKVRLNLRKELGLTVIDAAGLLVLVVLLNDDYLQFRQVPDHPEAILFFEINLKLPLEVQTRICNLAYDRKAITISTKDFDQGFKTVM